MGDEVELRYMSSYRSGENYTSVVVPNISNAIAIAQNLCILYSAGFDFLNGLKSMVDILSRTSKKLIDAVNIHPQLVFHPNNLSNAHCDIFVTSDLTQKYMMKGELVVTAENNPKTGVSNHHLMFGVRKNVMSRGLTPIELNGDSITDIMGDPDNENFKPLADALYPVMTETAFGDLQKELNDDPRALANKAADEKRREHRIVNAGPEVDQSNAIEKLNQCHLAFDNTFMKYGKSYDISDISVSRNQYDNSLIGAAFNVDHGTSGSFVAVPHMENGKKNGDSDVFYMQSNAYFPVEYNPQHMNDDSITFSDNFVKRFFSVSGALQSKIQSNHN